MGVGGPGSGKGTRLTMETCSSDFLGQDHGSDAFDGGNDFSLGTRLAVLSREGWWRVGTSVAVEGHSRFRKTGVGSRDKHDHASQVVSPCIGQVSFLKTALLRPNTLCS